LIGVIKALLEFECLKVKPEVIVCVIEDPFRDGFGTLLLTKSNTVCELFLKQGGPISFELSLGLKTKDFLNKSAGVVSQILFSSSTSLILSADVIGLNLNYRSLLLLRFLLTSLKKTLLVEIIWPFLIGRPF
jgi:hypothetical protein